MYILLKAKDSSVASMLIWACLIVCLMSFFSVSSAHLKLAQPLSMALNPRTHTQRFEAGISRIVPIALHGGAKKDLQSTPKNRFVAMLQRISPITRLYVLLIAVCTAVHLTGLPAPLWFGLDISGNKWLQIWRPFTSMAYFGTPSMSMASSLYFLMNYGQSLERGTSSEEYAWFLLIQTAILSALGLALGFPFNSKSFVTSIVYCSSRMRAFDTM